MRTDLIRMMLVLVVGTLPGCTGWLDSAFPRSRGDGGAKGRYSTVMLDDLEKAIALTGELRYAEAKVKLLQLLPIFEAAEDHDRTARTMFWLGYCNEKQNRISRARQLYEQVLEKYADSSSGRWASMRLTRLRTPLSRQPLSNTSG